MPPIVKENQTPSVPPETSARPASPAVSSGDAAIRQQPVALEIPVTVNGARTLDGSDKREPFSESTKTVLVFGNGAVIRLSASVAPGQLLFLTNEKTKKEVVCQVVKSKNYRNVSGYVELEFTEPVVGFWGMRFPGDRIGSVSQPAAPAPTAIGLPAASVKPVVPPPVERKVEAGATSAAPKIVESRASVTKPITLPAPLTKVPPAPNSAAPIAEKPVTTVTPIAPVVPVSIHPGFTANAAPVRPDLPKSSAFDLPRAPEQQASIFAPPSQGPTEPPVVNVKNWPDVPETKLEAPAVVPPPQPLSAGDSGTEALKEHTARLQEQLSSLHFADASSGKPAQKAPGTPVVQSANVADAAGKVLEILATEPALLPVKPAELVHSAPVPPKSSIDDEEMKIPAWLEPLARNAAAPASTQELVEREKSKRLVEQPKPEEIAFEPVPAIKEENLSEVQVPNFGNVLPIDENQATGEAETGSSSKGRLIAAMAAGIVLLAGGGWWYMRQESAGVNAGAAATHAPVVSAPSEPLQTQPQANSALQTNVAAPANAPLQTNAPIQTNSHAQTNTAALAKPSPNPENAASAGISTVPVRNMQPTSNPANGGGAAVTSALPQPAPAQPKKALLGDVRPEAPKATRSAKAQDGAEAEAGIVLSEEQPESNGEGLGAGLAIGNSQPAAPAAPLAVGGDVKQAKLISSVPPVYPLLAKNQHVSGDVRIDALIDANGHVTTMKIVSGPTLLHQAAMDALKQWKYRPAMLDGKPVAMHLTVTLQFRLQ